MLQAPWRPSPPPGLPPRHSLSSTPTNNPSRGLLPPGNDNNPTDLVSEAPSSSAGMSVEIESHRSLSTRGSGRKSSIVTVATVGPNGIPQPSPTPDSPSNNVLRKIPSALSTGSRRSSVSRSGGGGMGGGRAAFDSFWYQTVHKVTNIDNYSPDHECFRTRWSTNKWLEWRLLYENGFLNAFLASNPEEQGNMDARRRGMRVTAMLSTLRTLRERTYLASATPAPVPVPTTAPATSNPTVAVPSQASSSSSASATSSNSSGNPIVVQLPVSNPALTVYFNIPKLTSHARLPGTIVRVLPMDVLAAAKQMASAGLDPAVVIFGSASDEGGGFKTGGEGIEEEVFRRTDASVCHEALEKQSAYPLGDFTAIYYQGLSVFRDEEHLGYPYRTTPYQIDLISLPSYVFDDGNVNSNHMREVKHMACFLRRKLECAFSVALANGHDSIVVSPASAITKCAAQYKIPLSRVTSIFRAIVQQFSTRLSLVVLCVLEPPVSPSNALFSTDEGADLPAITRIPTPIPQNRPSSAAAFSSRAGLSSSASSRSTATTISTATFSSQALGDVLSPTTSTTSGPPSAKRPRNLLPPSANTASSSTFSSSSPASSLPSSTTSRTAPNEEPSLATSIANPQLSGGKGIKGSTSSAAPMRVTAPEDTFGEDPALSQILSPSAFSSDAMTKGFSDPFAILASSLGVVSPLVRADDPIFGHFKAALDEWDGGPGIPPSEEPCSTLPLPPCLNGGHCTLTEDPAHVAQYAHPVACPFRRACAKLSDSDHTFLFTHSAAQRSQAQTLQSANHYPEQHDANQDAIEEAIFNVLGTHRVKVLQNLSSAHRDNTTSANGNSNNNSKRATPFSPIMAKTSPSVAPMASPTSASSTTLTASVAPTTTRPDLLNQGFMAIGNGIETSDILAGAGGGGGGDGSPKLTPEQLKIIEEEMKTLLTA